MTLSAWSLVPKNANEVISGLHPRQILDALGSNAQSALIYSHSQNIETKTYSERTMKTAQLKLTYYYFLKSQKKKMIHGKFILTTCYLPWYLIPPSLLFSFSIRLSLSLSLSHLSLNFAEKLEKQQTPVLCDNFFSFKKETFIPDFILKNFNYFFNFNGTIDFKLGRLLLKMIPNHSLHPQVQLNNSADHRRQTEAILQIEEKI